MVDLAEKLITRARRLRGRIKRTAGRVTDDRTLQAAGRAEQASTDSEPGRVRRSPGFFGTQPSPGAVTPDPGDRGRRACGCRHYSRPRRLRLLDQRHHPALTPTAGRGCECQLRNPTCGFAVQGAGELPHPRAAPRARRTSDAIA